MGGRVIGRIAGLSRAHGARHNQGLDRMTALIAVLLVLLIVLAAAIVFGGPSTPAPLPWINNPFLAVDYSDLPPLQHFPGDDGVSLAYRQYAPGSAHPRGSVVLIHGSSASSASMHVLAKGYAHEGFAVYVLDMRGHGESGTKGTIAYVGHLEDDIDAFVRAVAPVQPATLAGFSAGGGFVLTGAPGATYVTRLTQPVFRTLLCGCSSVG